MITVNANLFRIAASCMSTESFRYYLAGVAIQPHPHGGAYLVSTDGHRLLCVYDESAVCDDDVIVALSKDALKACKPAKGEAGRTLTVTADRAEVSNESGVVAACPSPLIDGVFPDWHRVIPETPSEFTGAPAFNPQYVESFSKVARDLADHFDAGKGTLRIAGMTPDNPALVQFPGVDHAFGVLMPMRAAEFSRPSFLAGRRVIRDAIAFAA
jgi:DNA polymerase III sliding clamp (beta) subunit (PCNA family)